MLHAVIAAAHRALVAQVDGHLPRPARFDVLDALGPVEPENPASHPRLLASAALVERGLPVWSAIQPQDDRPALLVRAALTSPSVAKDTWAAAQAFDEAVLDLYDVDESISDEVGAAGHAAVTLVAEASFGVDRGSRLDVDDDELDSFSWDAVYFAEIALTTDDSARNREERHALWRWWLDEAVPAAAQACPRPGRSSTG